MMNDEIVERVGVELFLDKCKGSYFNEFALSGKSEQVQTTGAQLLNISELAIGGLAGDSGAEFKTQARVRTGYISVAGGKAYKLSGYAPYIAQNMFAYGADKTIIGNWNINTPVAENAAYVRISLRKINEEDFTESDLETLKKSIMFNAGVSALPWEPYTGGVPSPNPDYPQDIINIGAVSTGAQLLNLNKIPDQVDNNNISCDYTDGGLTCVFNVKNYGVHFKVPVQPNMIYTISSSNISTGGCLSISDFLQSEKNDVSVLINKGDNSKTFNSGSATELTFTIYSTDDNYLTVTAKDIMLNAGDTAKLWEPYTGGKPAPSVEYPQIVKVGVMGKNLFDTDNYVNFMLSKHNGSSNIINKTVFDGRKCLYINGAVNSPDTILSSCLPELTYTISYDVFLVTANENASGNGFAFRKQDNTFRYALPQYAHIGKWQKVSVTAVAVTNIFPTYGGKSEQYIDLESIQVEISETATVYNPYRLSSVLLPLTDSLCSVGEYYDCITQTKYIKRCFELRLNGSEEWMIYTNSICPGFYVRAVLPEDMIRRSGLCNQLLVTSAANITDSLWIGTASSKQSVFTVNSRFYDDSLEDKGLSAWKNHLAIQPLIIITYLDTPVETALNKNISDAFCNLHTYAGRTLINNTENAEMKIKYRKIK